MKKFIFLFTVLFVVFVGLIGCNRDSSEVAVAKKRLAWNANLEKAYALEEKAMQSVAEKGRKATITRNVPLVDGTGEKKLHDFVVGDTVLIINTEKTHKPIQDEKTGAGLTEGMTLGMAPDKNGIFVSGAVGLLPSDSYEYKHDIEVKKKLKPSPHPWIDSSAPAPAPAASPAAINPAADGSSPEDLDVHVIINKKPGGRTTAVDLPGNWSACLGPDGSRICGDGKIKDNRFTSDKIILRDNGINSDKITFDFESLSKISFGSETGSLRWIDKSFAVGSLGGKKVTLAEFR